MALRLVMTLPVTNASEERSFIKLPEWLRPTMGQNKLNHFSDLSIESKFDFTSLIKELCQKKV